jgi:3'(2'), 5'-bisphosphate nucleotidase
MTATLTPDRIERDLAFAIEAAELAGARVTGLRDSGAWEGKTMADIGDQAADGFLQGFIRGRYPEDGILSEETGDSPARLSIARTWIVDPLDGTREYSQGREDWAVHVALVLEGECALGAVALPAQSCTLWGVTVEGQERFGIRGEGELVRGDSEPGGNGLRVAISRSHTPPWMERFCEELGSSESVRCGSVGNKVTRLLLGGRLRPQGRAEGVGHLRSGGGRPRPGLDGLQAEGRGAPVQPGRVPQRRAGRLPPRRPGAGPRRSCGFGSARGLAGLDPRGLRVSGYGRRMTLEGFVARERRIGGERMRERLRGGDRVALAREDEHSVQVRLEVEPQIGALLPEIRQAGGEGQHEDAQITNRTVEVHDTLIPRLVGSTDGQTWKRRILSNGKEVSPLWR